MALYNIQAVINHDKTRTNSHYYATVLVDESARQLFAPPISTRKFEVVLNGPNKRKAESKIVHKLMSAGIKPENEHQSLIIDFVDYLIS